VTRLAQWQGPFGDEYIERNRADDEKINKLVPLWAEIFKRVRPQSVLEVGANIGLNLRAISKLTGAELYAIEPNASARNTLLADGVVDRNNLRGNPAHAIDFRDGVAELAFTSGVLIHIPPDDLLAACKEIHRCASRFVLCIEYFSDRPEAKTYRGQEDLLFKRDFGSFWLDHFPDLRLLDYGFFWKRVIGIDNLNWWLFEKN
jgi:pseudaminic acid biosynthesis-associated methylase